MLSLHYPEYTVNWATPVLFMCAAAVTVFVAQKILKNHLQALGFAMTSKDIEVDEDLPNFFKCVKPSQSDELVMEQ